MSDRCPVPALELHDVSRRYGEGEHAVAAVRDASLTVAPGEFVAIIGASGSGKSTLLNIAGGLDRPSAGTVRIDGVDLADLDAGELALVRRRTVGYVFQELNLIAGFTAAENVAVPLELDGVGRRAARAEADELLAAVGLEGRAHAFPDDLSGGERQRVAIARALTGDRRLVLADEPTGALDTANGAGVVGLLGSMCARRAAVVVVTHDPAVAAAADRTVVMRDGRVHAVDVGAEAGESVR